MEIVKTTCDKIKDYRVEYLKSLPEFQELFIEIMINNSDFYLLKADNENVGYAIKNNDSVLIEFTTKCDTLRTVAIPRDSVTKINKH